MAENNSLKNLEILVQLLKDSLEHEIVELRGEMREGFASMNTRFDQIERVTGRHSGIIVAGTAAIATITRTINRQEAALEKQQATIRDLTARVRTLERRRANGKGH